MIYSVQLAMILLLKQTTDLAFYQSAWFVLFLVIVIIGISVAYILDKKRTEKVIEKFKFRLNQRTIDFEDKAEEFSEMSKSLKDVNKFRKAVEKLLVREHNENMEILNSLNEGVFILNPDHSVNKKFSQKFLDIINKKEIGDVSFKSLMEPLLTEQDSRNLNEHVDLMFNPDLDNETYKELKLEPLELHFQVEAGNYQSKLLQFEFKRIINNNEISNLICSVSDVTEIVSLREKLDKTEKSNKRKMDQLLNIVLVEPILLRDYLFNVESKLNSISETFRDDEENYNEILEKVYRSINSLRVNAEFLELKFLVEKLKNVEMIISTLRDKEDLSGNDFLPILLETNEIIKYIPSMNQLIDRVLKMSESKKENAKKSPEGDSQYETINVGNESQLH
ncbi:MAG: hypothetical protein KDD94_04000 [Calditrichaeota bacterium]|nr:hypothetical protein [Calditrichota bacterium]